MVNYKLILAILKSEGDLRETLPHALRIFELCQIFRVTVETSVHVNNNQNGYGTLYTVYVQYTYVLIS